ncbi:hypothetical protein HYW58_02815, partial [Candidatus Kaiserbacteria bacterium]|nr:hypothetical protein [Candidatus Kaiserbacteria bacterium]
VVTDKGFIPEEIRIEPGDTITWVNTGKQKHWPASDDHITHGNYPQTSERDCLGSLFDACRGFDPGEQWSFIFAFEGMWSYHDHLSPEITGTVFVEREKKRLIRFLDAQQGSFSAEPRIKSVVSYIHSLFNVMDEEEFRALSEDEQKKYIEILAKQLPEKAWLYLNTVGFENGEQVIGGHELAHSVGSALYKKYGMQGLKTCGETFGYGCYHGVVEEFMEINNVTDVTAIERECGNIFPGVEELFPRCIHGMAYPLLLETHFNLEESLQRCGLLTSQNKEYCADGIFLEYPIFIPPEEIEKSNLWNICSNLEDEQKERCAFYQPNIVRQALGLNVEEIKDMCVSAPEEYLKNVCAQSTGVLVAHVAQSDARIKELCDFGARKVLTAGCLTAAQQELSLQR